ncbi:MAG: SusC/RagA family TonB-linked outer membrane protein [Labilibaculum antarcticum]
MNKRNLKWIGYSVILIFFLAMPLVASAQNLTISGVVSDANEFPLPGVSISIVGTTQGTITNIDGEYTIEASGDAQLRFQFIGFLAELVSVNNQTIVNVILKEDVVGLNEVVVVGYGTQKRSSVTGSISSVSGEEISKVPEASLLSAIQGKAAGVSVVNNGSPGSAPTVRIRGNGSISYAADPLYIIDGVAATDMTNFNSKDIESMEVLKDASSTAIYGSRAANGVILITTKKGKKDGKMHINLNSYAGVQSVPKTLDLLNTNQYLKYGTTLNEAAGLATPSRFSSMDELIYDGATQTYGQTNTDWQDELFQNALISDNNVSLSTGNEKSNYYASVGYFHQDGIIVGTGYKRTTFRFNSNHDISDRIKFGQTLSFSNGDKKNEQSAGGRSMIMNAIRSIPYLPVTDPTKDGGYRGASSGSDGSDPDNPIKVQKLNSDVTGTTKWFGTAFLEFKLADGLTFKSTAGYDYTNITRKIHQPIYFDGFNERTSAYIEKTTYLNKTRTITNQLTFDKTIGNHHFNLTAVQEDVKYSSEKVLLSGNLETNEIKELASPSSVTVDLQENRLQSYLGRINYEYKDKYLLSLSVRADGSSKFAPGNKWGAFRAGSFGWRVTEEPFMQDLESVSNLKLRFGYGELGNNGIGNYEWQSVISDNTTYVFGDATSRGEFFNTLPNEDLKWETSKMTNIGLDLGLFDNKLTLTAEWFNKITDNLILAVPYAKSIGYHGAAFANVGKMKNHGTEFTAGYRINSGEFKSNLTANISFIRNKVLNLSNETATINAGISDDFGAGDQTRTVAGEPIQSFYGYKVDGIFQTTTEIASAPTQANAAPGDIRFKDLSGPDGTPDGVIDSYDRTFLGSYLPKFSYGLNFAGSYKKWDFSIFLQGVSGNKIYNGTKVITQGMLRLFNAGSEVMDAWTPTNTNTNIPRAISGDPNQNVRISDRFIEDGSYLRIKSLNVGYTVPLINVTNGAVQDVRFYVAAQNLLTITDYSGYDPEINGINPDGGQSGLLTNGVDSGLHPSPRSFLAGIQIKF